MPFIQRLIKNKGETKMDKQLAQDIYEKAKLDTTRELCKLVEGT